jgi:ankyrin repeat protein
MDMGIIKHDDMTKILLNFRFTALHHAALKGNTDITMALLDVQCNVNARDKKGL